MSKRIGILMTLALMLGANQQAYSSGFALIEQSASSMGNAYGGGAAIAQDASTIFFNPAGITRLCGTQIIGGVHGVFPVADFDDKGSILTPLLPPAANPGPGSFMTGNDGGDGGEPAAVGNFYASMQLSDCWYIGLGITAPFGLATDYRKNWKGRYHALRSYLFTIEFNPVVAYRLNRCWSFGAGVRPMYLHAKLSNAVDYGTIAWLNTLELPAAQQAAVQAGLTATGFEPESQDGRVRLKGNSWGVGGNFGVLYEPWCGTRFGASWRTQVKQSVKGTEKFTKLPPFIEDPSLAPLPLQPFFTAIKEAAGINTSAKSDVVLPDTVSISGYHELNSCWAVMADFTWTRWSSLKELRFKFGNEKQPDGVTTLKWRNTARAAAGITYTLNSCWKFRTGYQYDQTPIRNKELRTPRIPGNDRHWAAVGIGYSVNRCLHFDVAYAHLFVPDPIIDKSQFTEAEDINRGGLKGRYHAQTDIVSGQFVYTF